MLIVLLSHIASCMSNPNESAIMGNHPIHPSTTASKTYIAMHVQCPMLISSHRPVQCRSQTEKPPPALPLFITGHSTLSNNRPLETRKIKSKRTLNQGLLPISFRHNHVGSCGTLFDSRWSTGWFQYQELSASSTGMLNASKVCGMYCFSGSAYVTGMPVLNPKD